MTALSLTFAATRRESVSLTRTTFFADFLAGVREGLEIEARYHALAQKSTPDLAKLGLTRADITQAALRGPQHSI